MMDRISIDYEDDYPNVSGRELHAALGIKTRYSTWFFRMCKYGFTEGRDFYPFQTDSTGGRPATDHRISIPMAKELCMLQRSEKGKEFRKQFLAAENAWNEPDAVIERAHQIIHARAEASKRRISDQS